MLHPTWWFRLSLLWLRPMVSRKFWDKVVYVDRVAELYRYFNPEELVLPAFVYRYAPCGSCCATAAATANGGRQVRSLAGPEPSQRGRGWRSRWGRSREPAAVSPMHTRDGHK